MLSNSILPAAVYNALPTDRDSLDNEVLRGVGAIFRAHAIDDSVGVSVLHRHFVLDEDTVMLHDGLVSSSVRREGLLAQPGLSGKAFYMRDGHWQAFEFIRGGEQRSLPTAFLADLGDYVVARRMERRLALVRLHEVYPMLIEYENVDKRSCVCVPGRAEETRPDEVTTWGFPPSGGHVVRQACHVVGDKHEQKND